MAIYGMLNFGACALCWFQCCLTEAVEVEANGLRAEPRVHAQPYAKSKVTLMRRHAKRKWLAHVDKHQTLGEVLHGVDWDFDEVKKVALLNHATETSAHAAAVRGGSSLALVYILLGVALLGAVVALMVILLVGKRREAASGDDERTGLVDNDGCQVAESWMQWSDLEAVGHLFFGQSNVNDYTVGQAVEVLRSDGSWSTATISEVTEAGVVVDFAQGSKLIPPECIERDLRHVEEKHGELQAGQTLYPFRIFWNASEGEKDVILATTSEAERTAWVEDVKHAINLDGDEAYRTKNPHSDQVWKLNSSMIASKTSIHAWRQRAFKVDHKEGVTGLVHAARRASARLSGFVETNTVFQKSPDIASISVMEAFKLTTMSDEVAFKAFAEFASGQQAESGPASSTGRSASGSLVKGVNDNLKFLEKVELFKRLPTSELPKLLKACQEVKFEPGAKIITQGEDGHEFFVIKVGTAKVEVNGNMVATLKSGDYFGENALLRDDPRNATIICQANITALKITRDGFEQLGLKTKLEFAKRGAVAAGVATDAEVKPPCEKTAADIEQIASALKANINLNAMITLDEEKTKAMTDLMWLESAPKGTQLIIEGDLNADYFYVVNSGCFNVSKRTESAQEATAASLGQVSSAGIATLGPGTSFGELALLYFAPRAATITALDDSKVFVIARQQFKEIITKAQTDIASAYIQYLNKVSILEPLKDDEKKQLAEALTDFAFVKGEHIFEQGEKGVLFYILIDGEVSVIKDGQEVAKLAATKDSAQFFGEQALLSDCPRAASIQVTSDHATTLAVDKKSFDMLLGPLEELKKRGKDGTSTVAKAKAGPASDEKRFGNIFFKDLQVLGLLGCGGFGAVEMVEHLPDGEIFALKAMSKGYVLKTGMQKSVMSEKDVQLMCDSVFVVKLYECYNGEQSLYLLLELALGGELYATYNKQGLWGSEKCAKFYVAGTVFAFDHLHDRKIIFRDLKPENLLLNEKGHVKLTDMGLAKVVAGKTYTTCGTPDYFAPELIASEGHTRAVDWWTLGILNFELLGGHPPFESQSPMQIYQKVKKGIHRVHFPKACKGVAESLIKGNCQAAPSKRLPMRTGGTKNIKTHDWYDGFDWASMEDLTMEPPYQPPIKSKKDMANFSARKEDMPPQVPYKDPHTGWDKDFATST